MPEKINTSYPKEKINILFLENISDVAVKQFKDAGYSNVKKLTGAVSEAELIKEIKQTHILGIRSKTQVTPAVLDAAQKLQAIGCFCIGTDMVDLKSSAKMGIPVFNSPFSSTRSVAELIIAQIINLSRKIGENIIDIKNNKWEKSAQGCHEIRGKIIIIILNTKATTQKSE